MIPKIGDVIEGTGGAHKMRIQLAGRRKGGDDRVIYLDMFERKNLYLLFASPKNVQEKLPANREAAV